MLAVDALDGDAYLAGVVKCPDCAALGDIIKVGIWGDDDGGVVAQLQGDFLDTGD